MLDFCPTWLQIWEFPQLPTPHLIINLLGGLTELRKDLYLQLDFFLSVQINTQMERCTGQSLQGGQAGGPSSHTLSS